MPRFNTPTTTYAMVKIEQKLVESGPRWLSTMSKPLGAGFYSSVWGPLPLAFGRVPPEDADIYRAVSTRSGGMTGGTRK